MNVVSDIGWDSHEFESEENNLQRIKLKTCLEKHKGEHPNTPKWMGLRVSAHTKSRLLFMSYYICLIVPGAGCRKQIM